MNGDIKLEKTLETIYYRITDNMPSDVCKTCPIINMLGDLTISIKLENNAQIASELGLEGQRLWCPFVKSDINRSK